MTQARVRLRADPDGDPRLAAIYGKVSGAVGGVPQLYQALANAPTLLEGWIDFAWSLRTDAASDRGLRELAIMRVAQLSDSDYVWRSHWKLAQRAGVNEGQIAALADWRDSELFDATQRAVLAMTDELIETAAVSADTWAPMAEALDDQQAVEVVLTVSWYSCAARISGALAVPLEDWHARVPGLPARDTARACSEL